MLRLLALGGELEDGRLPDLVVLAAKFAEFCQNSGVEGFKEGAGLGELAFLDFGESITKDARLFLDVLEGKG